MKKFVVKVLNLLDPLELIVFPDDEYETEATTIENYLKRENVTSRSLAEYIYYLFYPQANPTSIDLVKYVRAAEIILSLECIS